MKTFKIANVLYQFLTFIIIQLSGKPIQLFFGNDKGSLENRRIKSCKPYNCLKFGNVRNKKNKIQH